jgi:hypothetical protein
VTTLVMARQKRKATDNSDDSDGEASTSTREKL